MKTKRRLLAAMCGLFLAAPSFAQQVPIATKPADVTSAAHGVIMHSEYAKTIGRMVYVWGWPMVNQMNRRAAITQAPAPGRLNGVLPVAPRVQIGMLNDYIDPGQNFVTCPNQDVVYGLGFFSLDEEPVIIQGIRQTNPPSRADAFLMHCWDASSAEELPPTSKQPI